jgi:hypothetical protein
MYTIKGHGFAMLLELQPKKLGRVFNLRLTKCSGPEREEMGCGCQCRRN